MIMSEKLSPGLFAALSLLCAESSEEMVLVPTYLCTCMRFNLHERSAVLNKPKEVPQHCGSSHVRKGWDRSMLGYGTRMRGIGRGSTGVSPP